MPPTTTAAAPAAGKRERRASVRFQSNAKGSCQTLSVQRETAWEATVRDISGQGVGLLLNRRFETGVLLAVELTEPVEGRQRLLLARVVRAVPQPEGNWLIGCTLITPLGEDEVRALL